MTHSQELQINFRHCDLFASAPVDQGFHFHILNIPSLRVGQEHLHNSGKVQNIFLQDEEKKCGLKKSSARKTCFENTG